MNTCPCGQPAYAFLCDDCDRKAQYGAWVEAQRQIDELLWQASLRQARRHRNARRRDRRKRRTQQEITFE